MTTLWQLLVSFGQIGLFALGGGNSMLKLIGNECVHQRGWLSIEEFSTLVGVSFLFPGLTVIKVSGLIGMKVAGFWGLVVSMLGITLPGMVLAAIFYSAILARQDAPIIKKILVLMQYGAVALLAAALVSLLKPLEANFSLQAAILSTVLFFVVVMGWSPFAAVVGFVLVGVVLL